MKPRVLYLLLLFTSLLLPFVSANPASGSYDCAAHDPTLTQNQGRGCLANLEGNEDLYEECRDPEKTTTCFLFLEDPPFVTFWKPDKWNVADGDFRLQTPFRCGDFENAFRDQGGIDGIAMRLHNMTSSGNDLCIWAGDFSDCSFNQLVDYTQIMAEQDYRFAVSGVLLELPSRQCRHEPSAPFVDNEMIVIGLTPKEIANNKGALHQLTRPFHWGAWAIFLGTMLLFMLVCVIIAIRIHVFRGRSLVTAFFIFVGARDHAIAHETEVTGDESNPTKLSSFAVKYGLATTMYRIALVSFVGIFLLFYEVAVVNFLFQQQDLSLAKSVKSLTVQELQQYAVTKNSAVESVWNATGASSKSLQRVLLISADLMLTVCMLLLCCATRSGYREAGKVGR